MLGSHTCYPLQKKKDKQQATYLEFVRICSPFILPGWLHSVVKVAISASHSPAFPISYMISSKQDAKKTPLNAPIYISATRRNAVILIIHHLFFLLHASLPWVLHFGSPNPDKVLSLPSPSLTCAERIMRGSRRSVVRTSWWTLVDESYRMTK